MLYLLGMVYKLAYTCTHAQCKCATICDCFQDYNSFLTSKSNISPSNYLAYHIVHQG